MENKNYRELQRNMMKLESMIIDIYDATVVSKKCPLCKNDIRLYLPFGVQLRQNAQCPVCRSLERHRALWLYFEKNSGLFDKPMRLLHFAPEACLVDKFKNMENVDYYPVDLNPDFPGITKVVDICDIPYENNYFDMIICNHVLEHIPKELKALNELYRVLNNTGIAFLNTPVFQSLEKTLEKEEYNTPELREIYYGQSDHVRKYGKDYINRLRTAGFLVENQYVNMEYSYKELRALGLDKNECIYICKK